MKQLFTETENLIKKQTEITVANTINFQELTWMSTNFLRSKASQITNAMTHVFADSVLCVGIMGDDPIATWKGKIKWYLENNHWKELNRIDGKPTELEWKMFPGFTTLGLLEKIQKLMKDLLCEPEHFNNRIIFMSMYNDIVWEEKGNTERCEYQSQTVANYARRFPCGRWSFLGLGSEKKWYGTYSDKPDGAWDKTAEQMMLNFAGTSHPMCSVSTEQ